MIESLHEGLQPEELIELDYELRQELGGLATRSSATEEFATYVESAVVPDYVPDELAQEQKEIAASREEYVDSLPHGGLKPEKLKGAKTQIIDSGLPVAHITYIGGEPNGPGNENVVASFGTGKENKGHLTFYDRWDREPPAGQIATTIHEQAHGFDPLNTDPETVRMHGGEEKRAEAEAFAYSIAEQSLITDRYFNGYQKLLAKQLIDREIDYERFVRETYAIIVELALTNREKLRQTEEAQHNRAPKNFTPISVVSRPVENGEVKVEGIDKQMITVVEDVESYDDLMDHVDRLHKKYSSSAPDDVDETQNYENVVILDDFRKRRLGRSATYSQVDVSQERLAA